LKVVSRYISLIGSRNKFKINECNFLIGQPFMDGSAHLIYIDDYNRWSVTAWIDGVEIRVYDSWLEIPTTATNAIISKCISLLWEAHELMDRKYFSGHTMDVMFVDEEGCDLPVTVYYHYYRGEEPRISCAPEDSHPGTPDEFDVVKIVRESDGRDIISELDADYISSMVDLEIREAHYKSQMF